MGSEDLQAGKAAAPEKGEATTVSTANADRNLKETALRNDLTDKLGGKIAGKAVAPGYNLLAEAGLLPSDYPNKWSGVGAFLAGKDDAEIQAVADVIRNAENEMKVNELEAKQDATSLASILFTVDDSGEIEQLRAMAARALGRLGATGALSNVFVDERFQFLKRAVGEALQEAGGTGDIASSAPEGSSPTDQPTLLEPKSDFDSQQFFKRLDGANYSDGFKLIEDILQVLSEEQSLELVKSLEIPNRQYLLRFVAEYSKYASVRAQALQAVIALSTADDFIDLGRIVYSNSKYDDVKTLAIEDLIKASQWDALEFAVGESSERVALEIIAALGVANRHDVLQRIIDKEGNPALKEAARVAMRGYKIAEKIPEVLNGPEEQQSLERVKDLVAKAEWFELRIMAINSNYERVRAQAVIALSTAGQWDELVAVAILSKYADTSAQAVAALKTAKQRSKLESVAENKYSPDGTRALATEALKGISDAELPEVELPKVELPKVELPEVELPIDIAQAITDSLKSAKANAELPELELPEVELPKVESSGAVLSEAQILAQRLELQSSPEIDRLVLWAKEEKGISNPDRGDLTAVLPFFTFYPTRAGLIQVFSNTSSVSFDTQYGRIVSFELYILDAFPDNFVLPTALKHFFIWKNGSSDLTTWPAGTGLPKTLESFNVPGIQEWPAGLKAPESLKEVAIKNRTYKREYFFQIPGFMAANPDFQPSGAGIIKGDQPIKAVEATRPDTHGAPEPASQESPKDRLKRQRFELKLAASTLLHESMDGDEYIPNRGTKAIDTVIKYVVTTYPQFSDDQQDQLLRALSMFNRDFHDGSDDYLQDAFDNQVDYGEPRKLTETTYQVFEDSGIEPATNYVLSIAKEPNTRYRIKPGSITNTDELIDFYTVRILDNLYGFFLTKRADELIINPKKIQKLKAGEETLMHSLASLAGVQKLIEKGAITNEMLLAQANPTESLQAPAERAEYAHYDQLINDLDLRQVALDDVIHIRFVDRRGKPFFRMFKVSAYDRGENSNRVYVEPVDDPSVRGKVRAFLRSKGLGGPKQIDWQAKSITVGYSIDGVDGTVDNLMVAKEEKMKQFKELTETSQTDNFVSLAGGGSVDSAAAAAPESAAPPPPATEPPAAPAPETPPVPPASPASPEHSEEASGSINLKDLHKGDKLHVGLLGNDGKTYKVIMKVTRQFEDFFESLSVEYQDPVTNKKVKKDLHAFKASGAPDENETFFINSPKSYADSLKVGGQLRLRGGGRDDDFNIQELFVDDIRHTDWLEAEADTAQPRPTKKRRGLKLPWLQKPAEQPAQQAETEAIPPASPLVEAPAVDLETLELNLRSGYRGAYQLVQELSAVLPVAAGEPEQAVRREKYSQLVTTFISVQNILADYVMHSTDADSISDQIEAVIKLFGPMVYIIFRDGDTTAGQVTVDDFIRLHQSLAVDIQAIRTASSEDTQAIVERLATRLKSYMQAATNIGFDGLEQSGKDIKKERVVKLITAAIFDLTRYGVKL